MSKIIEFNPKKAAHSPVYAVISIPCIQPVSAPSRRKHVLRHIAEVIDMVMSVGVGAVLFLVLAAMLISL